MKDELWIKRFKERLDDYSEPVSGKGWEQLERKLSAPPPRKFNIPRRIAFRRWAVTAAAVLIVAFSSVTLWFLQSPVADEVKHAAKPALAVLPDALPDKTEADVQTEKSVPVQKQPGDRVSHSRLLIARNMETNDEQIVEREKAQLPENSLNEANKTTEKVSQADQNVTEHKEDQVQQSSEESKSSPTASERQKERRATYRPSGKDKLQRPLREKTVSKKEGWSFGVSMGNPGALASTGNANGNNYVMADPSSWLGTNLSLADMSDGAVTIPEGEQVFFKNGIPYLHATGGVAEINHKQPISFGISVRKGLYGNFSVETGLTYTLLASEIRYNRSSDLVKQNLHYVGIPLRFNWSFLDKNHFLLYLSTGAMVEKCVYGEIGSYKETVGPLQLSLLGAFGMQYKLSRRVGLYVEPGVSYFFDDGSPVETIRKENPFDFTLQAGIRFSY